jgi:hypothetical protein
VAVIYGQESVNPGLDELQQFWIDAWSPDLIDVDPPAGSRGVLCAVHGEQLMPPRGWTLVDRREAVPQLFKPRLVVDHSRNDQTKARDAVARRGDRTEALQRRMSDVPRPQLFSEIESDSEISVDISANPPSVNEKSAVAVRGLVNPEHPTSTDDMEIEIDGLLDASGPLLRDAFRRAASGKRDATRELLRPTSIPVTTSAPSESEGS